MANDLPVGAVDPNRDFANAAYNKLQDMPYTGSKLWRYGIFSKNYELYVNDTFGAQAYQKFLEAYADQVDPTKVKPFTGIEGLKAYEEGRFTGLNNFTEAKTSGDKPELREHRIKIAGKSLEEHLASRTKEQQEAAATIFKDALKVDIAMPVLEAYAANLRELHALLVEVPPGCTAAAAAGYVQAERGKTHTAIKEQHDEELKRLEAALAKGQQIYVELGINGDDAQEKFAKQSIDTLKAKQDEQLKAFDKTAADDTKALTNEDALENERMCILRAFYHNQKSNRKLMDKIAEKNAKKPAKSAAPVEVGVNYNEKKQWTVQVSGLKELDTLLGRTMTQSDKGVFSMQLPAFGPLYYRNRGAIADFTSMAQAVRARVLEEIINGERKPDDNGITMTIDHKDNDHAMSLGRIQYEACLLAGFPADKISIKVNGKEFKGPKIKAEDKSELFKGNEEYLQKIQQEAAARDNEPLKRPSVGNAEAQQKIRETIAERRASVAPEQEQEEDLADDNALAAGNNDNNADDIAPAGPAIGRPAG